MFLAVTRVFCVLFSGTLYDFYPEGKGKPGGGGIIIDLLLVMRGGEEGETYCFFFFNVSGASGETSPRQTPFG